MHSMCTYRVKCQGFLAWDSWHYFGKSWDFPGRICLEKLLWSKYWVRLDLDCILSLVRKDREIPGIPSIIYGLGQEIKIPVFSVFYKRNSTYGYVYQQSLQHVLGCRFPKLCEIQDGHLSRQCTIFRIRENSVKVQSLLFHLSPYLHLQVQPGLRNASEFAACLRLQIPKIM